MPPKQQRKRRSRKYADYSKEMLMLAAELVQKKTLSSYEAESKFGIPRRTILNRVNNKHVKLVGRAKELSVEEEQQIARVVVLAAKHGYPLSVLELRSIVYRYLKINNKKVFKGKMPGEHWAILFLKRHNLTQSVKRRRASKTAEEMQDYFEHLRKTIENVLPLTSSTIMRQILLTIQAPTK